MKSMCLLLCAAMLVMAAEISSAQTADDPTVPVPVGRWISRFRNGGLFLDFDGIPLIKGGIVQVFSAGFKRGYYGSGANPPKATMERLPDGGRAYTTEYHYSGAGNRFQASQRVEVRPDNTVRVTLRTLWQGAEPALLEWNAARLWAYPLAGAEFEASPPDPAADAPVVRGRLPLRPLPTRAVTNRIANGWKRLTLRLPEPGDLTITNETPDAAGDSPALLDGRNDPFLRDDRVFWLGFAGAPLTPGRESVHTLSFTLVPRATAPASPHPPTAIETKPAIVEFIPHALRPPPPLTDSAGTPILIPQPKHVVFTQGDLRLRGPLPITIALPDDEVGQRTMRAARDFAAEIGVRTGVRWTEMRALAKTAWNRRGLLVTTLGNPALPQPLTPALTLQPEGYALVVTPQFAAVVGRDAAGAFYGLQTLRQLLRLEGESGGGQRDAGGKARAARFLGADITDWPSLRMRAAHLFVGKEALPFHRKLIERIFSRYKLNTLLIECEYTKWKSHPEIWESYSMDPADLREEVKYARDRFMEPIPLVNSLGHSEWIFKNGQHLELAEDVTSPHAYDASNPESYRFIFSVFDETLDIFHPRYFHIGHDEVKIAGDEFGRYPARPQNIAKGVTALFAEDTNRLANWLGARGVAPMLWGDMLLHASEGADSSALEMSAANAPSVAEAEKRRSLLPHNAVIADWRYEAGSEQRNGLEIFRSAGHPALGTAWFEPENIRGWARQAIEKAALGTIQATWAGYDSKEALLDEEYRQFTAFVLAAEYAWSGTALHPRSSTPDPALAEADLLPYDVDDVFARSYADVPASSGNLPGWRLNFDSAVNVALADASAADGFLTDVPGRRAEAADGASAAAHSARRIAHGPDGETIASGIRFRLPPEHTGGVLLRGLLGPRHTAAAQSGTPLRAPDAVTLHVGAKAGELAFVHATLHGLESGALAASYTVVYSDGRTANVPLRYGREIRALDDGSPEQAFSTRRLPMPKCGAFLRVFRWRNPHPELTIAEIQFRAGSPLASPILFAVTGLR